MCVCILSLLLLLFYSGSIKFDLKFLKKHTNISLSIYKCVQTTLLHSCMPHTINMCHYTELKSMHFNSILFFYLFIYYTIFIPSYLFKLR